MVESGLGREAKGKMDKGVGKTKEVVGDITKNREMQAKGQMQQGKGHVEEATGKAQRRIEKED